MTSPTGNRRLSISAFGIHTGGGLVLLRALLAAAAGRVQSVLLDIRLQGSDLPPTAGVRFVAHSFAARVVSLTRLAAASGPGDVLLCFNSLPPLVSTAARVVTFVQAPHFVGLHQGVRYPLRTTLRLKLEATWFRAGARHSDEIWVQTQSMARAMQARFPRATVQIVPLVDDALLRLLVSGPESVATRLSPPSGPFSFFYPADGVGHKNHATLLQAWRLLADAGLHPRLALTLRPDEMAVAWQSSGIDARGLPHVVNLGHLKRDEVLRQMRQSSALMFASRAETFGLPMLEACAMGVPVLAAERDFVRDVCAPVESFDPLSAHSIADAVARFVGAAAGSSRSFCSGSHFVEKLLA